MKTKAGFSAGLFRSAPTTVVVPAHVAAAIPAIVMTAHHAATLPAHLRRRLGCSARQHVDAGGNRGGLTRGGESSGEEQGPGGDSQKLHLNPPTRRRIGASLWRTAAQVVGSRLDRFAPVNQNGLMDEEQDHDKQDWPERWGRRLGRALGYVFAVALLANLFTRWLF